MQLEEFFRNTVISATDVNGTVIDSELLENTGGARRKR